MPCNLHPFQKDSALGSHRLTIRLILALLLWLPLATQAQWFSSSTSNQGDFLPVLEAFQPAAWHDGETLYIGVEVTPEDRKSTRLNSSHVAISYAVFCLKKKG